MEANKIMLAVKGSWERKCQILKCTKFSLVENYLISSGLLFSLALNKWLLKGIVFPLLQ